MTRNTKIALGCGGGGCLGLILLVIAVAVLIYTGIIKAPGIYSPRSNSNYNSNYNYNSNTNTNDNLNSNSNSSSVSDDDKHKLFQAAAASGDPALTRRVWAKLGLLKANGSLNEDYGPFIKEHFGWVFRNTDFIQSINTKEKARAYVEEHIDD